MSSLLLIDRSRTGHRHVPFSNIHNYTLVVIVLTTLAIIFIPTSHIPTSHIQRSRLIFGGPILGLRHALPDGLRSTEGVSLRIMTRWMTAPFWIRTVPFVETYTTLYGPVHGVDTF